MKYFSIFVSLFVIDQITKALAYSTHFGDFLNWLRPIFGKEIFPNYNFAFSLRVPELLMYLIYAALLVLLGYLVYKNKNNHWFVFGAVLIFVGALSNIFDRVLLGYVRDFIFVFWGNIFNLSDVYILFGLLMLLRRS